MFSRRLTAYFAAFTVAAIAVPGSLWAQDATSIEEADPKVEWPRGSLGDLQFFADAALFRGVQGFALQEFYTVLDARQLQFVPEGNQFVSQVDLSLIIRDAAGQVAGEENWTRNFSVSSLRELKETGGVVRDQIGFSLKAGDYTVLLTVEDIYGDSQGEVDAPLLVEGFEATGFASSGVLFATAVAKARGEGRFVRNGWEVIPRTTRVYQNNEPIRFYHELYNLSPGSSLGAFDVRYFLLSEEGVPVSETVDHRYKKGGESAVLIDSIAATDLDPGRYFLEVQSLDLDNKMQTRRRSLVFLQSEEGIGDGLTEDQKVSLVYYRHIKWVAEEADLNVYGALERLEPRDKFLKVFWKRLDPTPSTVINEKLIEHVRRMRYAHNNFSGGHRQSGYDTDKGRVYVRYGPPSDREYRSAVDSVKPYEVWTYDTQGTYEFVFRDRRGIGVYELVHSTYPGELYNPNWQNEI